MTICSACSRGFDSEKHERCPYCGAYQIRSRQRGNVRKAKEPIASLLTTLLFVLIILVVGVVAIAFLVNEPESASDQLLGFIALITIVVYGWSIRWAYVDAEERGKSGCLVALVVALLSWPISLLVWAVFRP
jgi:hypothetical protein